MTTTTEEKKNKQNIIDFNRRKLCDRLDKLSDLINGRALEIKEYVSTDKGSYSEKKTRELVAELMDYIRDYRFEKEEGAVVSAQIQVADMIKSTLDSPDEIRKLEEDTQKKIEKLKSDFLKKTKKANAAEDIFLENFLYCVIRLSFFEGDRKPATLGDITDSAKSLRAVYESTCATNYEADGYISYDFKYALKNYHEGHYPSIADALREFYFSYVNVFERINACYFLLTGGSLPVNADITKYKADTPEVFKLLNGRKKYLKDEEKKRKELKTKYPAIKQPFELDWDDMFSEEEYPFGYADGEYFYTEPPMPEKELAAFKKEFKEADEFIKSCELFRFFLNTAKTDEFREKHTEDLSLRLKYGYEDFYEKTEYALERFISERNLGILSDTDACLYIYTLLSQAKALVEKKIGGE